MKIFSSITVFLGIFIFSSMADGRIVAPVNGEAIYESDLELNVSKEKSTVSEKEAKKIKLKRLIYAKVMKAFLNEIKIEVSADEVNTELKRLEDTPPSGGCASCNYSADENCSAHCASGLESFLRSNFLSREELKDSIRNDIGFKRYIEQEWRKSSGGPDNDTFIEAEKLRLERRFFSISHIFFKAGSYDSPADKEKARQKADDAFDRLKSGESFESVAIHCSEDKSSRGASGKLGCISRKSFNGELAATVDDLEDGSYSKPVQTGWGFHIVRKDKITNDDVVGILKTEFTRKTELEIMKKAEVKKFAK